LRAEVPLTAAPLTSSALVAELDGISGESKPGRGRPLAKDMDKTLETRRPWEQLGMSRRTWYRRRKELADREV
jgi:hypothetical protein